MPKLNELMSEGARKTPERERGLAFFRALPERERLNRYPRSACAWMALLLVDPPAPLLQSSRIFSDLRNVFKKLLLLLIKLINIYIVAVAVQ